MATAKPTKKGSPSMAEVMDELQTRFLVNLPASELASSERLFFQIEQCYWFYEDFYADQFAHLAHVKLNDFARQMFAHCPLLRPLAHQCDELFQDFKTYQRQVPVVGCILMNPSRTKLLLVRNWKGTSWSFPRGKVNQGETDTECARREVQEECGYDVGEDGLRGSLYLEFVQNEQRVRMYICTNVPEDFTFAPQTRKEISLIQWFAIDSLPKKTWSVMPFMARLKRWINRDKARVGKDKRSATPSKVRAASAPKNRPASAGVSNTAESPASFCDVVLNANVKTASSGSGRKKASQAQERSVSTPHNASRQTVRKQSSKRGHFGTEVDTATSYDGVNDETFGASIGQFSVEDMFTVNERLTGQKFVYDGNPHDFGKQPPRTALPNPPLPPNSASIGHTVDASRGLFNYSSYSKGVVPVQILTRPVDTTAPLKRVDEENGVVGGPVSPSPSSAASTSPSSPRSSEQAPFGSFKFDAVDIMACVT
jgi:mRNA-decapping enzyme subunit 2